MEKYIPVTSNTFIYLTVRQWEFPGGPVVRTRRFHCSGLGSIPGQGTKIPQAMWLGQKSKQTIRQKSKPSIEKSQNFIEGHFGQPKCQIILILMILA